MPRMARLVVPGYPHHITQRGNRRQQVFFGVEDYEAYLALLAKHRIAAGLEILAYCLMPNHVHLVVVPCTATVLAAVFGKVHKIYAERINAAHGWTGHLWQQRFYSVVLDEPHLTAAIRYVELNPVRSGICSQPEHWPWSSAQAHLGLRHDNLLALEGLPIRIAEWRGYLSQKPEPSSLMELRRHTRTGRPVGDSRFVDRLEALTGKKIHPGKRGRRPKTGT